MAFNKNYLQLEFGTGKFFEYSGKEKEGYEEHVSTKGNTSYRKYYDVVEGELDSVSVYDGKFGQSISVSIKNGNDVYYTPVDLYDQRGNISTYAESLIKLLPKLNKGDNIAVRGYNFTPEGEQYAKIGISIKVDGQKVKSDLTNAYYKDGKLIKGDIPAIEWKKVLGKNKPSASSLEAKDEYLIDVLAKEEERLTWKNKENTPEPKQKLSGKKVPTATPEQAFEPAGVEEEEDDQLPF